MKIFRIKNLSKFILIKIFIIFLLLNNVNAQEERKNLWRAFYFCEEFENCLDILNNIEINLNNELSDANGIKDFFLKKEFVKLWYQKAGLLASSYKDENILTAEKLYLKIINDKDLNSGPTDLFYYSHNNLGWMYHTEIKVFNPKRAVELMTVAANQNFPTAINNLGVFYDRGLGVKKDYKKSFELYSKASELGEHYAHGNIAKYYILGLGGANKNYFKAINHLKLATISEFGNNDNYFLKLLLSKQRLPKDEKEFIFWMKEGAIKNQDRNSFKRLGFELDNTKEGYFWFFLCSEYSVVKKDKLRCKQEMKILKKILPNQLTDNIVELMEKDALNWYKQNFKEST